MRKLFRWLFKQELAELSSTVAGLNIVIKRYSDTEKKLRNMLDNIDISVDVNEYEKRYRSSSWACISIQGKRMDFVKFVNLSERDIQEIGRFLKNFERGNVDCSPSTSPFLKFDRRF